MFLILRISEEKDEDSQKTNSNSCKLDLKMKLPRINFKYFLQSMESLEFKFKVVL
jgi:hypothetical protein